MFKVFLLSFSMCAAGDSALTHYGLSQGLHEANHLTQNPLVLDSVRGGTVFFAWTIRKRVQEAPRTASIAMGAIAALQCGVVISNIHQVSK